MECWISGKPAHASCRFCGRFVSKEHAAKLPFFMSVYIGKSEDGNPVPKVIVVADAIWCGVCRPQPEPIEMPEIF
jgi:hypothetical protein